MFRFPWPRLLWWWVGRLGKKKKKKKERTLEGLWVPEKAGLLNKRAWLQSQLENVVFSFVTRSIDVNLKRQGHHIIPIVVNKTRSCACKLKYFLLWLVNLIFFFFFFFYFSNKMGRSGDGKRNILLGWPYGSGKRRVHWKTKWNWRRAILPQPRICKFVPPIIIVQVFLNGVERQLWPSNKPYSKMATNLIFFCWYSNKPLLPRS